MNQSAQSACRDAIDCIHAGSYDFALANCKFALQQKPMHSRAWSKLMLAIRELNRLLPAESAGA